MYPRLGVLFICLFAAAFAPPALGQEYDVLLAGGRVIDGTGNPAFYADVAIRDGIIVEMGRLQPGRARRVVDVTGKVIVPGFIDLHSHADGPLYGGTGLRSPDRRRRSAPNLITQGITTVVVNHDGRSVWPIAEQRSALEKAGIGLNVALLIGHGTIRRLAMGEDFQRPATSEEIARMVEMVRQGVGEGALGLSSGLEYVPGRWSTTEEVEAVVGALYESRGVYITHERASGADPMWYWPSDTTARPTTFLDAVAETIRIADATGVTSVQTHMKARGADYWGSSHAAIQMIERARARGVDIWGDHYPYNTTGSDGNTVLIPRWALGGGRGANHTEALQRVLADEAQAARLRADIAHEIGRRGAAENILVMDAQDSSLVGLSLAEVARRIGGTPVDAAIWLQVQGDSARPGGVHVRGFSLSYYDVESYAQIPWMATATDGWIVLPEDGLTHVRVYGTFPRKIAYYARDRGLLSVPDAIRSATSLPARIMGFTDRGMVGEGMQADLAVLDLERLEDRSTFFDPHQYADGVDYVMVGGVFVVEDGEVTEELPGRVIVQRGSNN
ncbi:MAG: amidohydrolase family protein [Gemmatimonadota bacterium]|nr:amidohydrolase family protein [Gemmatimonadota bacterium]